MTCVYGVGVSVCAKVARLPRSFFFQRRGVDDSMYARYAKAPTSIFAEKNAFIVISPPTPSVGIMNMQTTEGEIELEPLLSEGESRRG